jgi:hypothetical protein
MSRPPEFFVIAMFFICFFGSLRLSRVRMNFTRYLGSIAHLSLGFFGVMKTSMVKNGVLSMCHQLQVLWSVVSYIAVYVMNVFTFQKPSSKNAFHNISMLSHGFSVNSYIFIVNALVPRHTMAFAASLITTVNKCSAIYTRMISFTHNILQTKSRHLPFRSSYLGMIIQRKVTTLCERIKNYLYPRCYNYIISTSLDGGTC